MKIRITRDTGIPLVDAGRVFDVCGISYGVRNEKVYFIHHGGTSLGIRAEDCEVIEREAET